MADVFDSVFGQPRVRDFLRASVSSKRISHAYLFSGPSGSNKTSAAYSFAQSIICENGGCGTCDDCQRVQRRKHPDVRFLSPEGAGGYLVEQIRGVVADAPLAPIRSKHKVYILDRVDLLGIQAANAFLKTLEEPPADVTFILLGRTLESVLPTIVSRCQVVPFRHIPATEAAGILSQNTGAPIEQARIAIEACDGSITRGIAFMKSRERIDYRRGVLDIMASLEHADDRDILDYARELAERAKAPLDNMKAEQEAEVAASSEYLTRAAIKQIEQRNKRALSAASSEYLRQTTAIIRSWLRDVLMVLSFKPDLVINVDAFDAISEAASFTDAPCVVNALEAARKTDEVIAYNVSPETSLDVLLFDIRKNLYGTDNPR